MAMLVGAVAISRSIRSDDGRRRLLAAAQDQVLVILGVNEGQTAYAGN